jgi:replicative DNA helicase
MAHVRQPDLPAGAACDFFSALHELYAAAGRPSTRRLEAAVGGATSHTTLHKALAGPKVPGWGATEVLVEGLALSARRDQQAVVERFRSLWGAATTLVDEVAKVQAAFDGSATPGPSMLRSVLSRTVADTMEATLDEVESLANRAFDGRFWVPTGLDDLDALAGGFRRGTLTAICGRPSVGKTTLMLSFARTASIRHGLHTAYFCSDMPDSEIHQRLLSAEGRVAIHHLRGGYMTDDDWRNVAHVMGKVSAAPLWTVSPLVDSIDTLITELRSLAEKHRLHLILIDSWRSLISASTDEGDDREVTRALRDFKRLAIEANLPVVVSASMSHPTVGGYGRNLLTSVDDHHKIERAADLIILLDRPDLDDRDSPRAGELDLIAARHRNGPTGTITVAFQGHYNRVLDLARPDEPSA